MVLGGAYLEIAIIGQQQYCQHLWHWVGPGNIYTCTLHENINIMMMVAGFDVENKILRETRKKKIRAIILCEGINR